MKGWAVALFCLTLAGCASAPPFSAPAGVFNDRLFQAPSERISADDVSTLLWAAGFGVRYRTPVGPIRVDFGRRLQRGQPPPLLAVDATTGAVTQVPYAVNDSCCGLGGSGRSTVVSDNLCVLHVAIGEAF